jgi:type II secretory pathway pseudopilin PulG
MKKKQGFSLIEVLVFTSILALVFITISAAVSSSLAILKVQEHKILATHYAEELLNWLQAEKEADWIAFAGRSNDTYCFNANPIVNWPATGSCLGNSFLDSIFKREVVIGGDSTKKNITITVKWLEANGENKVTIKRIFNPWEE